MTIQAIYRDGALYPVEPLDLPENTPVRIAVVPQESKSLSREEIIALRPKSPRFTAEQLRERLAKHAISAPSLPEDFSRADIYSDHD